MSRLGELISKLCPNGVRFVNFIDVIDRIRNKAKEESKDIPVFVVSNRMGLVPFEVYRGDDTSAHPSDDTSNYTVVRKGEFAYNPARLNVGSLALMEYDICLISPMYVAFRIKKDCQLDPKYVLYFLKSSYVNHMIDMHKEIGARFRFDYSKWEKIKIPVPPIEIQQEIINLINKQTKLTNELIDELSNELILRNKQYSHYRDNIILNSGYPIVTLKSVAVEYFRGSGIKRDEITNDGIPCVRYGEIYTTYGAFFDKCVSHTDASKIASKKAMKKNDLLFAITGELIEDIGKTTAYIGEEEGLVGGDIFVIRHKQNPIYLSYALSTSDAVTQKGLGKVKSKVVHTSASSILSIKIPLPSLKEQDKVASILSDLYLENIKIQSEIQSEIELRQAQYKHYRDKLLSFKELKA